jgi:predicted Na+-dependent transporter
MGLDVDFIEVAGSCLLFFLVFGMSATVDIGCMMAQLKNRKAIATASFLQFIVLPFLGFIVVKALNMSAGMGITLLVITSSPGGSYSNWWCSMFNADLALSVTMTAISTLLSTFMLPLNLLIYASLSYDAEVIQKLDWWAIFISLGIVLSAIALGLLASEKFNSHNFNLHANRLGNFAGISLVIFSGVLSNTDTDSQLWERPWIFYIGVAAPCVFGLIIANIMATWFKLIKPERVYVVFA